MLSPHLQTQRISLRPADTADGHSLYELLLRLGMHRLPSVENFLKTFDRGVAAMFAVQLRNSGETIGYGSLQQRDPNGHIQVGIFTEPEKAKYGVGGESMMLLTNYAFATWEDIRKVYFLTTEANLAHFGSALSNIPREATFPQHSFFAGQLWDVHWYAIYREDWEISSAPVIERLVAGPREYAMD